MIDDAVAAVRAERLTAWDAVVLAAREREANRVRYTAADLKEAAYVCDQIGWHHVVRVNGKSVTVTTPYSWTDRIPVENILEFREAQ
ncbi:hypothetical protein [Microbacterium jejuense]|uniref:hypothetical protein n=1 Tax=Microbacterium jejuense TaxID=1263637 RepID=UPI0031ECE9F3